MEHGEERRRKQMLTRLRARLLGFYYKLSASDWTWPRGQVLSPSEVNLGLTFGTQKEIHFASLETIAGAQLLFSWRACERRENYTAFGRGKKNPDETKDLTKGHLFLDSSF